MMLKALLLSSDEKTQRVVRRVLSDLEINLDCCTDAESAINKLTRWRYESVVLDFAQLRSAEQVLRAAKLAPANKRAIVVAMMDANVAVADVFSRGVHFALYKNQSLERIKSNFRAVRALMRRERRRNTRVEIDLKVVFQFADQRMECRSHDLGEGGMAVRVLRGQQLPATLNVMVALPPDGTPLSLEGEVAWRSSDGLTGIRFMTAPREVSEQLKEWVARTSGEVMEEDGPIACELTDLSPGACYLKTITPFPKRTRVSLQMRVGRHHMRAEGVIRVAHPETGMGIEFLLQTPAQRSDVEALIQALCENPGERPEFLVEPEEMDADIGTRMISADDPLHALFIQKADMPIAVFHAELRKQRGESAEDEVEILN